ncbi:hypothetical protein VPH234P9_0042 [Vibrio phage 234P9]
MIIPLIDFLQEIEIINRFYSLVRTVRFVYS